jgi:hypothetical protein
MPIGATVAQISATVRARIFSRHANSVMATIAPISPP